VQLARDVAYSTGIAGSRDRTDGAVFPPDYGKQVRAVVERRAVLAGYRLADLFDRRTSQGRGL
jgi:hypothetical protein